MKSNRLLVTLLFLGLLVSCGEPISQHGGEPPVVPGDSPFSPTTVHQSPEEPCEEGTTHWFPLEISTIPNQEENSGDPLLAGDYYVDLVPPQFFSEDCLCKIQEYQLVFDDLKDVDLAFYNAQGDPIFPSEIIITEGSEPDTVVFSNIADLPGETLAILVDILNEDANLLIGGGLCIIDNFDGLVTPGITHVSALHVTQPRPATNDSIELVLIPTAMGTPMR